MTTKRSDAALCINSGSSSLKYALFDVSSSTPVALHRGAIDESPTPTSLGAMFARLDAAQLPAPTMVGHRVVHGGRDYVAPAHVDDALLAGLQKIVPLAPLHLPAAIAGMEAVRARLPGLPQVACFDTAFHAALPEVTRRLPVPHRFYEAGVRRYGFHGLSYEYVLSALGSEAAGRVIVAHLGSGASLVAIRDGQSIDTTMGLTPTGGIMMGTRSGDLDPGVLVYLAREHGLGAAALEHVVDYESGLLAMGGTSDMKTLIARSMSDVDAALAIDMFAYAVKKAIGAFVAALGGLDVLVFTGAIGERAAVIRAKACDGLEAFGIRLDDARNRASDSVISAAASAVAIRIVPTDEDHVIAQHTKRVCGEAVEQAHVSA